MARWQIMKDGLPTPAPLFDDGGAALSGEDGFSTEGVAAYVASLGGGADGFNYVGASLEGGA